MYNKFKDIHEVEQNPIGLINLEEVLKTGQIPSNISGNFTYNGLESTDRVFRRASDDIFGVVREGNLYPNNPKSE